MWWDVDGVKVKSSDKSKEPVKEKMRPSPVEEFFGSALYSIDCRGANLYVHENVIVIDKTGGGLWNIGDNNFKVIPFKSIVTIQAKLKSTILTGYVEFETANSPLVVSGCGGGDGGNINAPVRVSADKKEIANTEIVKVLSDMNKKYDEVEKVYIYTNLATNEYPARDFILESFCERWENVRIF